MLIWKAGHIQRISATYASKSSYLRRGRFSVKAIDLQMNVVKCDLMINVINTITRTESIAVKGIWKLILIFYTTKRGGVNVAHRFEMENVRSYCILVIDNVDIENEGWDWSLWSESAISAMFGPIEANKGAKYSRSRFRCGSSWQSVGKKLLYLLNRFRCDGEILPESLWKWHRRFLGRRHECFKLF